VADVGDLNVVTILLSLEQEFAIPLDVDEALPDLTFEGLLILVQRRAMFGPTAQGADCKLYDLDAWRQRAGDHAADRLTSATLEAGAARLADLYEDIERLHGFGAALEGLSADAAATPDFRKALGAAPLPEGMAETIEAIRNRMPPPEHPCFRALDHAWPAVPDDPPYVSDRACHARHPLQQLAILAALAFAAGMLAAGCFCFAEHVRHRAPPTPPVYGPWSYIA
jgi:hypothetical protein